MAGGLAHQYPRLATPTEALCSKVEGRWGFLCGEDFTLWSVREAYPSVTHMTPISEAIFSTVNDLIIGHAWTRLEPRYCFGGEDGIESCSRES
jgi:hypothetical protein